MMLLLISLVVGTVVGIPINSNVDPMQNPDLFGGDMLGVNPNDKNAIPGFQLRWPGAVVAYEIDPSLEKNHAKILEAMKDYEDKTCITFKKRTLERDYIRLFSGQGCYSHVGKVGGGQPVSLAPGCIFKGTIVHELGHALGFYHEQNRSDRDDYLIIYWDNIKPDPMQNPDLFGGDMLGVDPNDKNVIPGHQLRWPGAIVPYELDASLEKNEVKILEAMKHYEEKTCITFKKRTYQRDYIRLFSGQGCYSHVGMVGGQQPVSLAPGCIFKGTIVHELGHALGFYHEQNRSDRDDYLIIYWDNIKPGLEDQFTKLERHRNTLLDTFDYTSVMLYGNTAFSKDNKSNTMVARTGVRLYETYDKPGLSASDIKRLRKMYWCDEEWMKKQKKN